jgi:hypothetical protein
MWLLAEYLPEVARLDHRIFPSVEALASWLAGKTLNGESRDTEGHARLVGLDRSGPMWTGSFTLSRAMRLSRFARMAPGSRRPRHRSRAARPRERCLEPPPSASTSAERLRRRAQTPHQHARRAGVKHPDLPRLAAQRAASTDLPRREHRGRAHAARQLADMGQTMPPRAPRQAGQPITQQRHRVEAAPTQELSNARVPQVNTQIGPDHPFRRFGYHLPQAVIALPFSLGGLCQPLPGC